MVGYSPWCGKSIRHDWALTHTLSWSHHPEIQFSSVQFSSPVIFDSLQPQRLQHTRFPCPSPTPRACSNSCPSSQWCHPTISSSIDPFFYCLQSFPASGSFPKNRLFTSGGQSIGVSALASVLPMNTQDWSPLEWTGWILGQAITPSEFVPNLWRKLVFRVSVFQNCK